KKKSDSIESLFFALLAEAYYDYQVEKGE
ncbi:MAG: hypothetical protein ACI9M1_001569, partial [Porticoccaceae bacterium]